MGALALSGARFCSLPVLRLVVLLRELWPLGDPLASDACDVFCGAFKTLDRAKVENEAGTDEDTILVLSEARVLEVGGNDAAGTGVAGALDPLMSSGLEKAVPPPTRGDTGSRSVTMREVEVGN
jgi:hypothetical protein